MNTQPHTPVFRAARKPSVLRFLAGPARLLTAQFNTWNAICLVALCVPALLVTALLTLPGIIFTSPQHYEYFEFAKQLNQGGDRWIAMGLSACCCLVCFAVPGDKTRVITLKR